MKIKILGCGNAFSTKNGNNCILLEEDNKRMLIDAGWALPYMLEKNGININSITDIYLSHCHADHIGGIEYVAFSRYDWVNKPVVMMNGIYLHGNHELIDDAWNETLKGGLKSIEGIDSTLETFFSVDKICNNGSFIFANKWECAPVQQIHIMTGSMISQTFGLLIKSLETGYTIYFVTDSQHCSPRQIELFYNKSNLIIQDCELIGIDTINGKLNFSSGVHANYAQLAGYDSSNSVKLSESVKSKMWLTHYQDFKNDNVDFYNNKCDWDALAELDGFAGFVEVGQEFNVK